jgi:RNA-directed DNA polymerase
MSSYYSKLCDQALLHLAWKGISKTNRESHGFDQQTIKDFSDHLGENIANLSRELRDRKFEFGPARGVLARKEGNKRRPIKVPAVRDRVVLSGVRLLISPRFEQFDQDCSYGYVRGRNVRDAINKVKDLALQGKIWVLEADIQKFFDTVNQEFLIQEFTKQIRAVSLLPLLNQAIRVEVGNLACFQPYDRAMFPAPDSGIPQGGVLSPMLANFYLHQFDLEMTRNGFNLVRYADDFVVMCKSKAQAQEAYQLSVDLLEGRLKLRMHHLGEADAKTKITNYYDGFTFLGIRFDKGRLYPSAKVVARLKDKIGRLTQPHPHHPILNSLVSLRNTLEGWGNAFKGYDSQLIFEDVDKSVRASLTKMLRAHDLFRRDITLGQYHLKILGIPSLIRFLPRQELSPSARPSLSTDVRTRSEGKPSTVLPSTA